jgi:hypothetical protein
MESSSQNFSFKDKKNATGGVLWNYGWCYFFDSSTETASPLRLQRLGFKHNFGSISQKKLWKKMKRQVG